MATGRPDRRPLLTYLKVQEQHEREVLFLLKRSAAAIDRELKALESKSGIGAAVRADQLRASRTAMRREIASLWRLVGSQVMESRALAAAAASDVMFVYDDMLLKSVMSKADRELLKQSLRESAMRGIANAESRLLGLSRIPLSTKVYRSRVLVSGQLDRLLDQHLARGSSAAEIAKDVRRFINPNTQGGVRYAANRLGRTELNNAFHATQVRRAVETPWITGMEWQLSGSHPRPDECNEYEGEVFAPKDVPAKPHPNCLCYLTPETVSREDFVNAFMAGEYDSFVG